jgi:NodT family efflux transporter outer membrane factor (OMF) lipoprotein
MTRKSRPRLGLLLALSLLLAGCAIGPDFHRPEPPAATDYGTGPLAAQTLAADESGGDRQRLMPGADIPAQWWTLFHSPELNVLVNEALKGNPDLKAAQAGLRVAMENLSAQRGAFLPAITASAAASRNQNAAAPSPFLASNVLLYNLYQAQLNASWTLDVAGGNRRAVEALRAQADAQRYQLESAQLALTANIVAAAIQEASLRAQIAATRDIVSGESEALDIFRRQNALGQIGGADVAAQEAALAQAEQSLPPLERLLAQQRDLIAALAGRLPSEAVTETFELSSLRLPAEVPVSLPSRLVEQRPDILIAEANLHAACAQVGLAEANMVPNITLTADPGVIATKTAQLFEPGSEFWSLSAGLTQPIFEGGTLLHKSRAAKAAYEEAAAQYRSTVLTAFESVADALHALQSDADLLKAAARSERAASASLEITRRQVELGAVGHLALLVAEQAYQQARIALIQAQAGRFSDTAALLQALGGGWWNRDLPAGQ